MSKIILEKMKFYAYHGCFREEQIVGTNFEITLGIDLDTSISSKTDNIDDTVNYQSIYTEIKEEMTIPSKLLEHLTKRIIDRLFHKFPKITSLDIAVSKLNPPLGGQLEKVTIQLTDQKRL